MPLPVSEIEFPKPNYGKETKVRRPYSDEIMEEGGCVNQPALETLLKSVQQHCPTSGLFHFWLPSVPTVAAPTEESESVAVADSLSHSVLGLILFRPGSQSCKGINSEESEYFREIIMEFTSNQCISQELQAHVELLMRDQTKSKMWCDLHNGSISSSKFWGVLDRRDTTPPDNLVNTGVL